MSELAVVPLATVVVGICIVLTLENIILNRTWKRVQSYLAK